jgi:adenosylmethionine-8-amino-7-oxononanoate aminotransferase
VAQENLDVIEEEGLVQRVAELEPVLGRAVEPLRDHPLVTDVRGPVGLLAGVQLSPEVPAVELFHACIERGVIIRVITGNTVQISPPFVIEAEELSEIVRAITGSLDGLALASAA